ncbi:MAG: ferredoxin family protein [Pirellulaceae bacterium]|nr:ferredoxin family protein [Pirellulaceae bacterium]
MIAKALEIQRVVLYEGANSRSLSSERRASILQALLDHGVGVSLVLPTDSVLTLGHRSLIVLGEFEADVPDEFSVAQSDVQVLVRNIAGLDAAAIVSLVKGLTTETGGSTAQGWKPWFPVIDYDRCTNCMQCLSFCLFDVYGATPAGKITVQNENNCKTDCPACSRVCPEVAILFPKYKGGPINGDVVNTDDIRREAMKVDISALLGGDIYSLLRDRSGKAKSRFSKERDDDRALKERQRCLTKLQESSGLDIPAEVLASLPSLDKIQEKAIVAKQRAAEALKQQEQTSSTKVGDPNDS